MSFLIDINPAMEIPKYSLALCRLRDAEPITSLRHVVGLKYTPMFVGIDNMTFQIPMNIMGHKGEVVRNPAYDLIEGDHLIRLNKMKYFVIVNTREVADDEGNMYKEVFCKSREYELIDKKLIDYRADSRLLYDENNDLLDGLPKGVLNYIFDNLVTAWRLNYVDTDIILREGKGIYRSLTFDNSNLIQVFMELQKIYNCIFEFDTVKREVNVHAFDKIMGQDENLIPRGQNRGLYISDKNFIKNITKQVNREEIITRLYLRGREGISVQSISPTGQPYIDNFDFYKNEKYMSAGLIEALNVYEEKVSSYNPDFEPLFIELSEANDIREELVNKDSPELEEKGLVALEREHSRIQTLIDVKIEELAIIQNAILKADGRDLSDLHATKTSIQTTLDALDVEMQEVLELMGVIMEQIEAQDLVIEGINERIKALQQELNTGSGQNFTEEQLIELDSFIKVDTFSDSNYTEDNVVELLEEGQRQISRLSQPAIQFEVDVVDFLNLVEHQHIWRTFVLGDVVTLEHKEMGFKFVVRLIGYAHDVDQNGLTLMFSNTGSYDDATLYERDLIDHIDDVGTTVDFNSDKWNDVGEIEGRLSQLIDFKLEQARQNILNAVGQRHLFDDSGLWLYKENPDGSIDDAQIRGINSDIALTDDNWQTVKTAISARDGINAELVRGKLGQFAKLQAHQIVVGDFGEKTLEDMVGSADGAVMLDELYNQVMISTKGGIQVFDRSSNERVRLGNYKPGKYGLLLRDRSGSTTVLDEDGILQTWQEGNVDNVGPTKPLDLYVFIPEHTSSINRATLRFKTEKFRAYSMATESKEAVAETTMGGGSFSDSTMAGGGVVDTDTSAHTDELTNLDPTADTVPERFRHNHGLGTDGELRLLTQDRSSGAERWVQFVPSGAHTHGVHSHSITLEPHSHQVEIPEHSHEFIIPEHKHEIEYGIYEGDKASGISVKINDVDYTRFLGGDIKDFDRGVEDLDITSLLEIGKWNKITLGSATLGRIEASIFIQAFIQTIRKSVIISGDSLTDDRLQTGIGMGESTVVATRPNVNFGGVKKLHKASIVRGIALFSTYDYERDFMGWTDEFSKQNAISTCISLNGDWIQEKSTGKWLLETQDKPHIFWVDDQNVLRTSHWQDESIILAENVKRVSSKRAWKNTTSFRLDQGIVAAYIKTDGSVWYRNYCQVTETRSAWSLEEKIVVYTGVAESVNIFLTHDFRTGFVITDANNVSKIIITKRNWAGMGLAPENISIGISGTHLDFFKINEELTSVKENLNVGISALPDLRYAEKDNKFYNVHNRPVVIEGVEDWGKELVFETRHRLYRIHPADFVISASNGVFFNPDVIEELPDNTYVLRFEGFNNFNNLGDLGAITYKGQLTTNGIGEFYSDFTAQFTPQNLVPIIIPLPEVKEVWNE